MPEALKESALAVRVYAIVPASPGVSGSGQQGAGLGSAGDKGADWQASSVKYTVPGTPVPFKFIGENVVIRVQVTPFSAGEGRSLVLIAQGQVWVKPPEGGLSYHTTIESLAVEFGETVLFFPLGLDPAGNAPMRLEIAVLRAADLPQGGEAEGKAGTGDKAGK